MITATLSLAASRLPGASLGPPRIPGRLVTAATATEKELRDALKRAPRQVVFSDMMPPPEELRLLEETCGVEMVEWPQ